MIFNPVDGTSFEFKLTSLEVDSFLEKAGNFFSIKSEMPNNIRAKFANGQPINRIKRSKPSKYSSHRGILMRLYNNSIEHDIISKIAAFFSSYFRII